jgi:hypothetical protein
LCSDRPNDPHPHELRDGLAAASGAVEAQHPAGVLQRGKQPAAAAQAAVGLPEPSGGQVVPGWQGVPR